MKKYFKYFIFVFLIGSIFCSNKFIVKAKAESFYEAEYIDNMWITREKGAAHLYQKARFFRNRVTNKESYCLDPFAVFNENGYYVSNMNYNSLSKDVVDKIKLAAYYGYGYDGHTDVKWYAITQVLIWRYAVSDGNFYFTNGLDGAKINSFDHDINSLNNLVNNHYKTPSFSSSTNNMIIGSDLTLTDSNNVLSNYNVTDNGGINLVKTGNKLTIKGEKIGEFIINLSKAANRATGSPTFYTSSTSQSMMSRGNVNHVNAYLKVKVEGGYITINKTDEDNKSCTPQGEASIDGAVYEIYDWNGKVVDTLTIKNCMAKSIGLPYGNYTIKEKQAGIGYQKDNKKYEVIIDKEMPNIEVNLTNKVVKSHIEITKLYGSKEEENYKVEPNIAFGLYDRTGNLINTYRTDKSGYIAFDLPFGDYVLKQLNSTFNYDKVDDIHITVAYDSDKRITYVLKNNLSTTKLKVIKKDKTSDKEILNKNAKFKIKNLKTNEYLYYLVDGEKNYIFEMNKEGYFITSIDLEYGKYSIEEVVSPVGYKRLKNNIVFEINEDCSFTYDEDGNKVYEITIYNEKEDLVIKVPDTYSTSTCNLFSLLIKVLYEEKKKGFVC